MLATFLMRADQVEAASRFVFRVIRTDEEPMITPSEWQIERTAIERKVPPRAALAIEGATA